MENTLLHRLEQRRFEDLRGARLHLELPVSRTLLNWYVRQLESATIDDVEIVAIRGAEVEVAVRTDIPFFKNRTLIARFHEQIPDLVLRVEITDGLNFLERSLLRPFLPDGLDLDGRELVIDLKYFLGRNPRLAFWADKVKNARVVGSRGQRLVFIFDIVV